MHLASGRVDNEKIHDLSLYGAGGKQVPQGVIFPVVPEPRCLKKILDETAEDFHVCLRKTSPRVVLDDKGIHLGQLVKEHQVIQDVYIAKVFFQAVKDQFLEPWISLPEILPHERIVCLAGCLLFGKKS